MRKKACLVASSSAGRFSFRNENAMAMGRVGMVVAMVALLSGVAFVYRKMESSRNSSDSSPGSSSRADISQGIALQGQINELKTMLKKLAQENAEMKKATAELKLRKEELKVCNENLAKVRKDKGKVESWATKVDDEKEAKSQKLQETRGKLENERVKSNELSQRVDAMQTKLAQTKSALKDIEKQKEESISQFRDQKTQFSALTKELDTLKAKGENKDRQSQIEGLISEMNKDLQQKSRAIQELTKQKKASDDMLRRLESKLVEAGVSPADIEEALSAKPTIAAKKAPVNPAALAMMQVGSSTGNSEAKLLANIELLFETVDENGDFSIDKEEFTRHLKPEHLKRLENDPDSLNAYVQMKFNEIDADRTGSIVKDEVLANPELLMASVAADTNTNSEEADKTASPPTASGGIFGAASGLFKSLMGSPATVPAEPVAKKGLVSAKKGDGNSTQENTAGEQSTAGVVGPKTDKQPSDKNPNEKVENEMGGVSSGSEQVVEFASDVAREGKGGGTGGAIGAAGSTNGQAALRESNMKKRAIAFSNKKINGSEADAGAGGAPKETAVAGGAGEVTSAVRVDPRKGVDSKKGTGAAAEDAGSNDDDA